MINFLPDIFKKGTLRTKKFTDVNEAVLFLVNLINKQADDIQDIYREIEELNKKEHLIIKESVRRICERLQIYGYKISDEDIVREARDHVEKNWSRIKAEVAEHRQRRSKAVDDLLKDLQ